MSNIELLRAAAAKLREAAAMATPPPWEVNMLDRSYVNLGARCACEVDHGGNAAWIALMSPDMAEPIASCLEEAAVGMQHDPYPPKHATAIAKAILGEFAGPTLPVPPTDEERSNGTD